jgi:hypothetical protein
MIRGLKVLIRTRASSGLLTALYDHRQIKTVDKKWVLAVIFGDINLKKLNSLITGF